MSTPEELELEFELTTELERRECEESYYQFFLNAWGVLEPHTSLVKNWHIEYLCDALQKEIERIAASKPKTKDLNLNIPPRSAKSYITSIMLCPWAWTKYPKPVTRLIQPSERNNFLIP